MKTAIRPKLNLLMSAIALLALASAAFAEPTANKPTAEEVKTKVAQAVDAIERYSLVQRDEAVKNAKTALDDLDARIARMESEAGAKWDQMDQTARRNMEASLTALRKQRNQVAEWYGGMQHSSDKAWEDVKKGFLNSYHELQRTFDQIQKKFQGPQG